MDDRPKASKGESTRCTWRRRLVERARRRDEGRLLWGGPHGVGDLELRVRKGGSWSLTGDKRRGGGRNVREWMVWWMSCARSWECWGGRRGAGAMIEGIEN